MLTSSKGYDNVTIVARLARDTIMLQHVIIHFSLHYLSGGRLQKVENKRKFNIQQRYSKLET